MRMDEGSSDMARYRTIKPEFWQSEQVVSCSFGARLLFIGIWNFADDWGRHYASVGGIRMKVFPGDQCKLDDVRGWISELLEQKLLAEYETRDGVRVWQVTGWERHQRISRRYPSKIPPPPEGEDELPKSEPVGHTPDQFPIAVLWNERCSELNDSRFKPVTLLSNSQVEQIAMLVNGDTEFVPNFTEAMKHLPVNNSGNFVWQPDFAWFLQDPGNVYKVAEGKYDKRGAGPKPGSDGVGSELVRDAVKAAMEEEED
jgi:hypothetical protein